MTAKLITLPYPVPILDEHLLKDENGQDICYLDRGRLQTIADNNNRRIQQSGDFCPLTIGHTKDGERETEAPPLVGYASNFFVSRGRREGHRVVPDKMGRKHYLFTRWQVYEDKQDALRDYPRRSVELWTSRWEVDPISLLGATTPDRDLGLVRMSDKGSSVRVMTPDSNEEEAMPFEDNDSASEESNQPLTLAQLQQTEEFQFLHQLMDQMAQQAGPEQPVEDEMGGEGEDEMPPDEGEEPMDEEPVRRSASFAGEGNSSFTPSFGNRQMNRSPVDRSTRIRLARAEAAIEATADENRRLKVNLARASRESDLHQLEAEGIELDISDELDSVAPENGPLMDEPRYQAHLEKIVKRYRRSPVARSSLNLNEISRGSGGARAADRQAKVAQAIKKARNVEEYEKLINDGNE